MAIKLSISAGVLLALVSTFFVGLMSLGMIDRLQLFGLIAASGFVAILALTCVLAMTGSGEES